MARYHMARYHMVSANPVWPDVGWPMVLVSLRDSACLMATVIHSPRTRGVLSRGAVPHTVRTDAWMQARDMPAGGDVAVEAMAWQEARGTTSREGGRARQAVVRRAREVVRATATTMGRAPAARAATT